MSAFIKVKQCLTSLSKFLCALAGCFLQCIFSVCESEECDLVSSNFQIHPILEYLQIRDLPQDCNPFNPLKIISLIAAAQSLFISGHCLQCLRNQNLISLRDTESYCSHPLTSHLNFGNELFFFLVLVDGLASSIMLLSQRS